MNTRLRWIIFPPAYALALVPLLWIYFSIDPHFSGPREGLVPAPVGYQVGYTVAWAFVATYWPALFAAVCLAIGMAPRLRGVAALAILSAVTTVAISYGLNLFFELSHRKSGLNADDFIQLPPAAASALVLCGYYGVSLFKRRRSDA